jgi:hypothetical protein
MELYAQGNDVFTAGGNTEGALALYEKALTRLQDEDDESSTNLQLKLFSNAALCHLSLRNYQVQLIHVT